MNDALSIAAANLSASATRFQTSAAQVTRAATPGAASNGDLATAVVGMNMAGTDFKASLAVFKTADKMMGALLDIVA
jgi:flagellar hook protein FlgE